MSLVDRSVRDLLAAFSSSAPTPGGGSASALASAIGASLLLMVAALPKTRSGSEDDRSALASAGGALAGVRDQLTDAIDGDTAAYDQVVAAYKLPKASSEEQVARKAAIQGALLGATNVPLSVMRLSSRALEQAATIAVHGTPRGGQRRRRRRARCCVGTRGRRAEHRDQHQWRDRRRLCRSA